MVEEISEFDKLNNFFVGNNLSLFLASNSPRRKWILNRAGLEFEILPATFNEDQFLENLTTITKEGYLWHVKEKNYKDLIHEICTNLAIQKALIIWEELKNKNKEKFIVIAADTIVYYNQFFLTKPKDKKEAFEMLKFLSGKTHTVITSHCVINHKKIVITKDIMTLVTFRKISDKDIQNYLETEEFIDKAGAYAIQGEGAILIDHIVGDYLNIVGLSLNAVLFLLNEIKVQSTL